MFPVMAGFKPMRVMISSAFFATFTMLIMSTIHRNTSGKLGTVDTTESSILKKTMLVAMSRHMLPNIRHQPAKISDVLLLPPMAKASGAVMVSIASTIYRSATSSSRESTMNMVIRSKIITNIQEAVKTPITLPSTSWTLMASGTSSSAITVLVSPRTVSQICGLARSRKPNTKVRAKSSLGSSPSKPSPEAMLRRAWNTRLPSSSAQPTAKRICCMSPMTGIWVFK